MRFASGQLWRIGLVGAVALLLSLLAPQSAHATCGDHVLWGKQPEQGPHLPMESPRGPKPCSGPECSQQPSPSPSPTPLRVTLEQERWPALVEVVLAPGIDRAAVADFSARLHPDSHPLAIFHPPR